MNEQQYEQLNTLLQQGILLLESLSGIYDSELEALSSKDLNKLSDITQEKTGLLNKFHQFTQERIELLNSFGIEVEAGDYQIPSETPNAPEANEETSSLHSSIKQLLETLQQKNSRNEQAIYRNQQNVSQLLAIVRGHKKQDQLYNKSGSSGLYKAQNRLGKA